MDRLEVGGVDTGSISAQVVDLETVWNRPVSCLPGVTVRCDAHTVTDELAIATGSDSAGPDMARGIEVQVHNDEGQRPARVVPVDKPDRPALHQTSSGVRALRDGGLLAAAALAQFHHAHRSSVA